jgi:RNA polymerase sigma-70 factor, ECF subfamily
MELVARRPRRTFSHRLPVNSPNELSDADCIARVRGGDRTAYDTLVVRYQDRLFNTLARLTSSADDAMDIAQDAFIQAYTKIDTFQGKAAFYTWLYRIAFNLAMSHGRKRRPLTVLNAGDTTRTIEPATTTDSPRECLEAAERVAAVQAAIHDLADDHRQVVVLRELEGCDYEQIAEILEIPVGTVRSRLFRARAQLKEKLASMVEGG